MINSQDNPVVWRQMKEMWLGERKPGYLMLGGIQYEVFTPNGEEDPVFQQMGFGGLEAYGQTSTGFPQGGNQSRKASQAPQESQAPQVPQTIRKGRAARPSAKVTDTES